MNVRTCAAALLLVVGLPTAVLAADFPEIEPNESKLDADANGAFVLGEGDSVSGSTTGASTTIAGIGSADTFRIKTVPAAAGIYRHRMTLTTFGSEGHIGTIRGLTRRDQRHARHHQRLGRHHRQRRRAPPMT